MSGEHKNWYENNVSAVLEYPFDFERYIQERLREIEDLDERRFAKEVLWEGLGRVIRCTEQKYRELEQRVYREIKTEGNRYGTVMTIIKRMHYDPTNRTLFPMYDKDLEEERLAEALSGTEGIFLGTIYLEMEESALQRFGQNEIFRGSIKRKDESKETQFRIRRAERYRKAVETLYQVFSDNHIPWETVNMGYVDRFYDVYLTPDDTGWAAGEGRICLTDAEIRFEAFAPYVRYDRIPLWNIEWITFDSVDFMLPSVDGICYEHEFSLEERPQEDGYLVCPNEDIMEIRREKGKIIVRSGKETFEGWKVLHLIQQETVRSLDYQETLLTNRRRDSFIRRCAEETHIRPMTKAGLLHALIELDIGEFVEPVEIEVCGEAAYPAVESMDWFIEEDIFPMDGRKVLRVEFREKKAGHYLNESMVRFAVSRLQSELSEYRCVGVITGGGTDRKEGIV